MTGTEWSGSPSVGAVGPIADLALLAAETLRPTLLETRWHREATTAQLPELVGIMPGFGKQDRSEEHTSELQSRGHLVCRLLLEKKKQTRRSVTIYSTYERSV